MAKREKLWLKKKISVFCKKDFDFQNQKYIAGSIYLIHKKKDELSYIKGENKISRNDYGYWFTDEDGKYNSFNEYFSLKIFNITGFKKGDILYCIQDTESNGFEFKKNERYEIEDINANISPGYVDLDNYYAPFYLARNRHNRYVADYFISEMAWKAMWRDEQINSILDGE